MKTTPFIKRLFASVFTAVTLATLATASLTQSASAAVDESLLEDMATVVINEGESRATISDSLITTVKGSSSAIASTMGTINTINNVKIDLSDLDTATGICNLMMTSIGSITDVNITVNAAETAYGILNAEYSTIGAITGADIIVSSDSGTAYGIYQYGGASITSFSGNITATTASGTAAALYITTGDTFTFNADSSLTATATDGGTAYAIQITVSSYSLTSTSSDTTITVNGDIMASSTALTLASGNYVLDGDITASSLSISNGASLTLTGETAFTITYNTLTLDLSDIDLSNLVDVDSVISSALLTIESGASISGLDGINIVFSENDSDSWNEELLSAIISDYTSALSGVSYTVYSGSVDGTVLATGEFSVIPEPSTATLGLFALAGLCIRRRRKAA